MWRHIASNALTLLILVMVLAGGLVLWGKDQFSGAGPLNEAICFRVESGASMSETSGRLEEQGAISNAVIFRLGADYSEKSSLLKLGSYLIEPEASMDAILGQITTAGRSTCGTEVAYRVGVVRAEMEVAELDPATNRYQTKARFDPKGEAAMPEPLAAALAENDTRYRVVLAEGVTSWQLADALRHAEFLTGEIEVPAEGALAPDSYEVRKGSERSDLIARMQVAQDEILAELWAARAENLPLANPQEAMILASIVEKETGQPEERRQVASVFVNRLNQGMRLQTDPTVIYGVTNGQGVLGRGLRQSELRGATPYNTYVIEGLPPTPIANPGRAAIEAALNPDETPYIFFVADGTGGHAFAVTLADHNRNVAEWRKIEAERAQ